MKNEMMNIKEEKDIRAQEETEELSVKDVVVITGGGSGMGLEAALCMPKEKIVIVAGRTLSKLERAVSILEKNGQEAYACTCDTSNRESVRKLAAFAASKGNVRNVINAAGLSPNMADPEQLFRVNALGTVYVNQEFAEVMGKNSVIVDISSNSAYALPSFLASPRSYSLAEHREEDFMKNMMKRCSLPLPAYYKSGLAYAYSKNFVIWYAEQCAFKYADRGIRFCSLSPGLVSTEMGKLEEKEGGDMLRHSAQHRMGTPAELGFAIAMAADERNGYLTGVDILVDGGSTTSRHQKLLIA